MRSFDELLAEATTADMTGWGFAWLEGRATEQRPPWGYSQLLATRLPTARRALDLDTGGGEVLACLPSWPEHLVATEAWAPNRARAAAALGEGQGRRAGQVVAATTDRLPFADATFDLVTSRHPVRPAWSAIARVLVDDGTYLAQHVGPASAFELIEVFLGPLPKARHARHPDTERQDAEHAGLQIVQLRTARCRMEFHDIGAVVWTLRKCPWWVPGFTVDQYEPQLRRLDTDLRAGTAFVAHSTRTLFEARRRPRGPTT